MLDIIDIPTTPGDFLGVPMHSPIALFYEKIQDPFNLHLSGKSDSRIFRTGNIQWNYSNDFLGSVYIDPKYKGESIIKFGSAEIDGNTSHDDLKQIIADGQMEYIEHYFSADQLNICVNEWAMFYFNIDEAGILLSKISLPFRMGEHRALLFNDPPKKGKGR
ncbi:MAG TPA: hypothetical protein VGE24_07505 [Emticicia sp.]